MSNHLALATVTAALGRLIGGAAQTGVQNATVRLGPPDGKTAQDGKPVVNLFLYQVTPNASRRNAHLPARRAEGTLANRSRIALDLRYIVSFYGDAAHFEAERMAGAVAVALEDEPLFGAALIRRAVQDNNADLQGSDLEQALSTVRITPESHSLDELSKLWSIFFQVPYALSLAYLCSHVSIETGADAQPSLPVAAPRIHGGPLPQARLEEVLSADGPGRPILWGGTLLIRGRGLNAPGLSLRVGGHEVALASGEAHASEIRLPLEPARFGGGELPAGVHTVQAVLPPPPGAPTHLSRASDARAFALRPRLTVVDAGLDPDAPAGVLTLGIAPALVAGQSVRVLLDERVPADPQSVTLAPQAPTAFPAAQLGVAYAGLRRSRYLVRAQVDGVESAPDIDLTPGSPSFGEIVGPEADLT